MIIFRRARLHVCGAQPQLKASPHLTLLCVGSAQPANPNLVDPRYPPQFLNNQSDRNYIVKWNGQISVAFLPVLITS